MSFLVGIGAYFSALFTIIINVYREEYFYRNFSI
jgi:hypothetical protein